jgi:DDE superfamily endonuclease
MTCTIGLVESFSRRAEWNQPPPRSSLATPSVQMQQCPTPQYLGWQGPAIPQFGEHAPKRPALLNRALSGLWLTDRAWGTRPPGPRTREQAVGGLTPAELAPIRRRLEAFADDIFASLARADQRARGEWLPAWADAGRPPQVDRADGRAPGEVHYQALHHFVAVSSWDWRPVRRRLAEVMTAALSPTAWVVDDTGFPKDGSCPVGVQRQYWGTLGKTANCQLGVSVDAVTEQASCPAGLAAVPPRALGRGGDGHPASRLPPAP